MTQQYSSALDIIYSLPEQISQVLTKLAALETRNAMLEMKLDALSKKEKGSPAKIEEHPDTEISETNVESDVSEVMEIRSSSASKQVNHDDAVKQPAEASQPLVIGDNARNSGIKIPSREVDPMPQTAIHSESASEKQTSTLIRGRLKEREGSSIAAVDVKIFDNKSVMVKKTKTAATGEWIAMLPPGEYTAEFTKPGQKPLFKPISIVSGKKELEILI
jgi:hypothetical protein